VTWKIDAQEGGPEWRYVLCALKRESSLGSAFVDGHRAIRLYQATVPVQRLLAPRRVESRIQWPERVSAVVRAFNACVLHRQIVVSFSKTPNPAWAEAAGSEHAVKKALPPAHRRLSRYTLVAHIEERHRAWVVLDHAPYARKEDAVAVRRDLIEPRRAALALERQEWEDAQRRALLRRLYPGDAPASEGKRKRATLSISAARRRPVMRSPVEWWLVSYDGTDAQRDAVVAMLRAHNESPLQSREVVDGEVMGAGQPFAECAVREMKAGSYSYPKCGPVTSHVLEFCSAPVAAYPTHPQTWVEWHLALLAPALGNVCDGEGRRVVRMYAVTNPTTGKPFDQLQRGLGARQPLDPPLGAGPPEKERIAQSLVVQPARVWDLKTRRCRTEGWIVNGQQFATNADAEEHAAQHARRAAPVAASAAPNLPKASPEALAGGKEQGALG
jgi:hypothetical protein